MSTFQGFNITGVDLNKYPVIMGDQILYNKIYLVLEPIDSCTDVEAQKVWGHTFRWMVENWEQFQEFNLYKGTVEEVPQLRFVLEGDDKTFISAEGPPLAFLLDSVSFIQKLVEHTNKRCIREIEDIEGHRQYIQQFNSGRFRN